MAEETNAVDPGVRATRPMTEPELKALTVDLQAVLVKHNAEMGVTSTINLMKVIETKDESETPAEEGVKEEKPEKETEAKADTEAEKGS